MHRIGATSPGMLLNNFGTGLATGLPESRRLIRRPPRLVLVASDARLQLGQRHRTPLESRTIRALAELSNQIARLLTLDMGPKAIQASRGDGDQQ